MLGQTYFHNRFPVTSAGDPSKFIDAVSSTTCGILFDLNIIMQVETEVLTNKRRITNTANSFPRNSPR